MSLPPPLLPPPPSAGEHPRLVRWGLWDVVLAFVVGIVVTIPVVAVAPDPRDEALGLFALLLAQDLPQVGYLWFVAKNKGLGSLRRDFGFVVRISDWRWFFAGVGFQLVALAVIAPLSELYGHHESQEVVKLAEKASGLEIPLIVLAVALIAPVVEELLFRGALLRGLLRRTTTGWAVFGSAAIFGVVHLSDGTVGSVIALPAIVGLGVISARQAVGTGELSRSILLHMGFNALTVVLLFA